LATETRSGEGRSLLDEFGGNAVLLLALIVLLTVVPFLPGHHTGDMVSRIVWTLVIIAGLMRASGRRVFLWIALLIAVPSLVSSWVDVPGGALMGPIAVAFFFLLVSAHILTDIFARRRIGFDQIIGGVNVYLLLGVLFARLHVAVASDSPEAYMLGELPLGVAAAQAGQQLEDALQYFSFATITTLGYGDIRPVSHVARMLSTGEAVVGQLFIAILIARIVGVYASQSESDA
jgi:hypothetical protein